MQKKHLIDAARYQNYIKLQRESAYYELSYVEKRQRGKKIRQAGQVNAETA
jgi:hypothetical protein